MPGSVFPTLPSFSFGEKPLPSTKLNTLSDALSALKVWTAAGELFYGYDANQLEKLVKPGSPGFLWMNASGVPAWLTGTATYVPRWNAAGTPTALPWLSKTYHQSSVGHSYSTASWRDMPNSSKVVTLSVTSTIVCMGFVSEYGGSTYGFFDTKFNIDGTDIDWGLGSRKYNIGEIDSVPVIGFLSGVPAGSRTIKLREICTGGSFAVVNLCYDILIIPD